MAVTLTLSHVHQTARHKKDQRRVTVLEDLENMIVNG